MLNNYQSGSGYGVDGTDVIFDDGDLYPVFGPGTFLWYMPILVPASPNDIRTYSAYVNDTWRLSDRLTFNLGLRWDKNDARDPTGVSQSSDGNLSPRLGVTWDPTGKGSLRSRPLWALRLDGQREADGLGIGMGKPVVLAYYYDGPPINADPAAPLVSSADALRQLFQWFGITAPGQFPRPGIDPFYVRRSGRELSDAG